MTTFKSLDAAMKERQRQQQLFAPFKADKEAWLEKQFSEEEIDAHKEFEKSLLSGDESIEQYKKTFDAAFAELSAADDGLLTKGQFSKFMVKLNTAQIAHGLKGRQMNHEWIDMAWTCYNGYSHEVDGVSKDDIL